MNNLPKTTRYGKRPLWQLITVYLILGALVYGAFYYLVLAKNDNSSNNTNKVPQSQTPVPSSAIDPSSLTSEKDAITVRLDGVNGSGQSGTASLSERGGKLNVTINLSGFEKDVIQPAHFHVGTCPGVGEVKYPLTGVTNGTSRTVLPINLVEFIKAQPLVINIHKSEKEASVYTACGPKI